MGDKKKIKKELDTLWSKAVKLRAGGRCEICGKEYGINSHHVIGRVNYNLRWDLRNGVALCISHHKFGVFSAHENPIYFMSWFKKHRPEDYEYIKNPEFTKFKTWYISDYEEIKAKLKEELDEIRQ